jgi:hypothetical protein
VTVARGNAGSLRSYQDGMPSASGMGPTVVLGQDLAEAAGPVRHGAVADLATGDRQNGSRLHGSCGKMTCSFELHDASQPEWPCPELVSHTLHAA